MNWLAEAVFELLPSGFASLWVEISPQAHILLLTVIAAALTGGALRVERYLFKALFAASSGLLFTYLIMTLLNFQ